MVRGLPRTTRAAGVDNADVPATSPYSLDIEIDERQGRIRIYDPRAFHEGRRGFCRRILEAAARHPGFERAEIDLETSVCRLDFDRDSATASSMAEAPAAAVRQATADGKGAGRARWWGRPSPWTTLTAYRAPDGPSLWETLDARPGRIRLRRDATAADRPRLFGVSGVLAAVDGIVGSRVSAWSSTLTVDYRPDSPVAHRLLDAVEEALREGRTDAAPRVEGVGGEIEVASGLRRLRYLALAGGSFGMTVVGLVVPGIPTVPFLLATSYYLARSSPRLNARLRGAPILGPVLIEWEAFGGLSRGSKARLLGVTAVIVAVTAALGAGSPVVLVVLLLVVAISIYSVVRLPGLPDEAPALSPPPNRRLALSPAR